MIEIIKSISGYLVIGCVWIIWFERFCVTNKIGGAFSNKDGDKLSHLGGIDPFDYAMEIISSSIFQVSNRGWTIN